MRVCGGGVWQTKGDRYVYSAVLITSLKSHFLYSSHSRISIGSPTLHKEYVHLFLIGFSPVLSVLYLKKDQVGTNSVKHVISLN